MKRFFIAEFKLEFLMDQTDLKEGENLTENSCAIAGWKKGILIVKVVTSVCVTLDQSGWFPPPYENVVVNDGILTHFPIRLYIRTCSWGNFLLLLLCVTNGKYWMKKGKFNVLYDLAKIRCRSFLYVVCDYRHTSEYMVLCVFFFFDKNCLWLAHYNFCVR